MNNSFQLITNLQYRLKAERQLDAERGKVTEQRHMIYELGTTLEEEKGKI